MGFNMFGGFSLKRLNAIFIKEFLQLRRDRMTFAMLVGIPLIQMLIFGYAINTNPKNLPTVTLVYDNSNFSRRVVSGMVNSKYFTIIAEAKSDEEVDRYLRNGEALFAVTIPPQFTRDLVKGKNPSILIEPDASDPTTVANALGDINQIINSAVESEIKGAVSYLKKNTPPFNIIIHRNYNPEINTQYNIIPGLVGMILTLTMVIITSIAITKEKETGTNENLLSTPATPLEIMIGKIVPYVLIGYVQVLLILGCAKYVFGVPILGSVWLLLFVCLFFIVANLMIGLIFSILAKTQMQAIQMCIFFYLPSIMLSGFVFPFYGMPVWAQNLGNLLPMTHFLPIVRGIMLKGNQFQNFSWHFYCLVAFLVVITVVGLLRYRKTLD